MQAERPGLGALARVSAAGCGRLNNSTSRVSVTPVSSPGGGLSSWRSPRAHPILPKRANPARDRRTATTGCPGTTPRPRGAERCDADFLGAAQVGYGELLLPEVEAHGEASGGARQHGAPGSARSSVNWTAKTTGAPLWSRSRAPGPRGSGASARETRMRPASARTASGLGAQAGQPAAARPPRATVVWLFARARPSEGHTSHEDRLSPARLHREGQRQEEPVPARR